MGRYCCSHPKNSKRQDNNANHDDNKKPLKLLSQKPVGTSNNAGKHRRLTHLLATEKFNKGKEKDKELFTFLENSLVRIEQGWNSKGRTIWRKLRKIKEIKKGEKDRTRRKDEFWYTTWDKRKLFTEDKKKH